MEFHIITAHGPVHLFSVEGGRLIPASPDPSDPLGTCGTSARTVSSARPNLQDHSAHDTKIDASVV